MPPELIDLDAQATSPLAPEALAAMLPYLERQHWNPHSAHRGGRIAKAGLEAAREQVARLLGRPSAGLMFTSGATEANNLALKGVAELRAGRILTFATEHSCVLETVRHLARQGREVSVLPVLPDGMPDLAAYRAALGADVALVSAMLVNNEVGSIWPITELADDAHRAGALFHTDAAQAFGKIAIPEGPDLVSLSAHKMMGPKGIGAVWAAPGVELAPLLDGGGQEGVRSGTQSPALAAGFGAAARRADPARSAAHARRLMEIALDRLSAVEHVVNGPDPLGPNRWPGNLSVTFPGVDSSRLMARLPNLALSSGAACSSGSNRPSHVLAALGLTQSAARQTLRLGWNDSSSETMIEKALGEIVAAVGGLG